MAAMTLSGLLHCGFLNLDKTVMVRVHCFLFIFGVQ